MDLVLWVSVILVGMCFGSFGTVLTERIPTGRSIVRPRSACPCCDTSIRRRDQIPVLSYALLRGRCHNCGVAISPLYPAIEIATAALFCLAWWRYGPTPRGLAFAGLAVITPPLTVIDIRQHRLPNALTAAGAMWALLCALAIAIDARAWQPLLMSSLTGLACAGGLLLLAFVSKGGMGMGDIKLAGVIGLVMGLIAWTDAVAAIVWAFVLGAVISIVLIFIGKAKRGTAVPFGPMLIAGAWLVLATGINPLTSFLILR